MGQEQSSPHGEEERPQLDRRGSSHEGEVLNVSTDELSHELAVRFSRKCFTPLEMAHFKDNFRSLADVQDGLQFWKEETLCRFLVMPDILDEPGPGALVYQITTYLGAFPFASQAPAILTLEAMVKVVVIMTERYGRVLRRGKRDRIKLLFRSLAVFDRRASRTISQSANHEKGTKEDFMEVLRKESEIVQQEQRAAAAMGSAAEVDEAVVSSPVQANPNFGYAVDQAKNDEEEEEDDDELALAALDSLDAIEVFKHDQRGDTKINHAQIPVDNFRRLVMLLLIIAPLEPQESLTKHAERLTDARIEGLRHVADCILWSFAPEESAGIFYNAFNTIIPICLPHMFDGFNALFEHFLFSKNLDLSRHRRQSSTATTDSRRPSMSSPKLSSPTSPVSPISPWQSSLHTLELPPEPLLPSEGDIMNLNILSQLSFFLKGTNVFRRLRPLYMASESGFSLGSIEHKVFNWKAPSILLVSGVRLPAEPEGARQRAYADSLSQKRFPSSGRGNSQTERVTYGAYLDTPWKHTYKEAAGGNDTLIFQLDPIHEVFRPSSLNHDYFTFGKSGIGFGSPPPKSRSTGGSNTHLNLGAVSLSLDESLEFGIFNHDTAGGGSFHPSEIRRIDWQDRFEIESLEIWGCGGVEEAEKQRKAWEFEEREAAARKSIRRGKDIESDRALLEMAGLVGNHNASGGSMG